LVFNHADAISDGYCHLDLIVEEGEEGRMLKTGSRLLLLHLPLLGASLIALVFSIDIELFRPLKTEFTFGFWVVVLVPISVLLAIVQLVIWGVLLGRRSVASRHGGK